MLIYPKTHFFLPIDLDIMRHILHRVLDVEEVMLFGKPKIEA